MIKYLDYSIGQIVSEIKTKSAEISSMTQNIQNSVITTGHSNGTINFWTPNYSSEPVIKILGHPTKVNHVGIDNTGNYLTSTGLDKKMRVWDLRNTYSQVFEYYTQSQVQSIAISQKGLIAVGTGSEVEIWKDYTKVKQQKPYLKHHFANKQTFASSMKFINYEDFLGIGTNMGYTQIVVPGSGEANFDTYEANPYETKKQKRNTEVYKILEKIPYTMININSEALVNSIDVRSKDVIQREMVNEMKLKSEEYVKTQKKKNKMRLSNKEKHDEIVKNIDKNQEKRNRLRVLLEKNYEEMTKEKEKVKNEYNIIKKVQNVNPELYLKEDDDDEEELEDDNKSSEKGENIEINRKSNIKDKKIRNKSKS